MVLYVKQHSIINLYTMDLIGKKGHLLLSSFFCLFGGIQSPFNAQEDIFGIERENSREGK